MRFVWVEGIGRHTVMMLAALAMSIAEAQAQSVAAWDDRCPAPSPPMSGASSSGALRWRATRASDSLGEFLLEGNARIAFASYLVCADTIVFDGRELRARGNAVVVEPDGTTLRATEIKLGPAATEAFKTSLGNRSP
jgi:hypothetical protein